MSTEKDEAAFPLALTDREGWPNVSHGLTKREYFAAMAMQGFCACQGSWEEQTPQQSAVTAVECADALIKELNK